MEMELTDLPDNLAHRLPHYPDLAVVLRGRIAFDSLLRGQERGEILLMDALARALTERRQIAALAVIVDAKDEAAVGFYQGYGVQQLVDQTRRPFLPMQTTTAVVCIVQVELGENLLD